MNRFFQKAKAAERDRSDAQRFEVDRSLMTAVAGIPMPFGGDVPVDAIYASASGTNVLDGSERP